MLETTIGDLAGSASDLKNLRRKDFTPLFHPEARFTDDTVAATGWGYLLADVRAVLVALYGTAGQGA